MKEINHWTVKKKKKKINQQTSLYLIITSLSITGKSQGMQLFVINYNGVNTTFIQARCQVH